MEITSNNSLEVLHKTESEISGINSIVSPLEARQNSLDSFVVISNGRDWFGVNACAIPLPLVTAHIMRQSVFLSGRVKKNLLIA